MPAGEIGALRREAVAILEDLAERSPEDTRLLRTLSLMLVKAGDHAKAMGRRTEALEMYLRVLEIDAALSAAAPEDIELLDNLFWSDQRIFIELRDEEPTVAAESRARQERVVHELLARSPDRPGSIFAMLQFLADEPVPEYTPATPAEQIREAFAERLELGRRLISLSPDNRGHLLRYAGDLSLATIMFTNAAKLEEAAACHARAAELYEPLLAADPFNPAVLEVTASHFRIGSNLALARGDIEQALDLSTKEIEARRRALTLLAEDQQSTHQIELAGALGHLAMILCTEAVGPIPAWLPEEYIALFKKVWQAPIRPDLTRILVEHTAYQRPCRVVTPASLSQLALSIRSETPGSPIADLLDAELRLAAGDADGAAELFQAVAARAEFPDCARHAGRRLEALLARVPGE
jgi:tetratricopeptide (TPR) repeat protein